MSMELTSEQIAEAFSRHDFEASYPDLAEDVRWNMVGESLVQGKANAHLRMPRVDAVPDGC